MAIQLNEKNTTKVLAVQVSGMLAKEDYERFVPEFKRLVKRHGKIRLLIEMNDFQGCEAGALWGDIKFDVRHFTDIERLAMVGDRKWVRGVIDFCETFTTAKTRYFECAEIDGARTWLTTD